MRDNEEMPVRTPVVLFTVFALTLAALTGCAPSVDPSPAPGTSTEPTVEPAPEPVTEGAPLEIDCRALVSDQAIYDYNSNLGLLDDFSPESGTMAERVVELGGTACAWQNETSGEMVVVAAANPSSEQITELQAEPAFVIQDGIGEAQAFSGLFWVVASSPDFLEAGDATPLLDAAIATLD